LCSKRESTRLNPKLYISAKLKNKNDYERFKQIRLSNMEDRFQLSRRALVASTLTGVIAWPEKSQGMELPAAANQAWEALGGGPSDLFYPETFLGPWQVTSVLVDFEMPMGQDKVKDARLVQRAKSEMNDPLVYEQRFIRNKAGKVIADRIYNVEALVTASLGGQKILEDIQWDPEDPNIMRLSMRQGPGVFTRVTRRFQDEPAERRLDTSEFIEQVFESADDRAPRVKASRCLTKYKWRTTVESQGGPSIVATQVVSDFPTSFEGAEVVLQAQGRPEIVYTYKMTFQKM